MSWGLWGLHTAVGENDAGTDYSLPSLWQDYRNWVASIEPSSDPKKHVQSWANVENYLSDRHGLHTSPNDGESGQEHWDRYFGHPATFTMAKLHSLAQSRSWVDEYDDGDYMLSDDDLTQGAALGLLKIRRNQKQDRFEPDNPEDEISDVTFSGGITLDPNQGFSPKYTASTASTDGIRYAHIVEADVAEDLRRLAMPSPLPEGTTFTSFHPGEDLHGHVFGGQNMDSYSEFSDRMSGIAAHVNGNLAGHLVWFHPGVQDIDLDGSPVDVGNEVASIKVDRDLQRHNIATSMWDQAKKLNPDLRHSPVKTRDGRGWADYEQSRHARLGMAWDEWAPKVRGGCTDGCALRAEGRYTIPQAGAFMDYVHRAINGKPAVHVISIYTHPSDRGSGAAEAMIRRLVESHPGHLVNPGTMTNDGQKFHDRLLDKDPSHRDLIARLAMAWPEWAPQIQHAYESPEGFPFSVGKYHITHGDGTESSLSYLHRPERKLLQVQMLGTEEPYQRQGIAEAFLRRLHADYPDHRIEPGGMSDDGQAFHDRMLNKEPEARGIVTAGRNGPPPPMTYEPFNTMWTNGTMARHAEDGRPLAHLHWYPDGEIETIRVHPEMRGRGVGKEILTHAAAHPETYEAEDGIKPSNTLTPDGRAFARSLGHDPSDEEVTPAEGEHQWAWKAVQNYVPMHIPYTGQNEDEMSRYLDKPWASTKTAAAGDGWPVWWRGRQRPAVPFDKRWHPNHPEHVPGPWES